jgi:CubicO group peptidase (beta-lactamase class C family)
MLARAIRRSLAGAGLLLLPALTVPPAAAQTPRARQVALLDSIASSPVLEKRVAGVAAAVVHRGDTLLMKTFGKADLEWDVPLTTDAVFEIGSVTKQFTAAAILQLRDAGKLDLDADLTTYLPDYPTQGHRIPVRRLLDHTSGIKGATEMPVFRNFQVQELPRDSLVKLFAAEPFDFAPGEALIYNNSAYILLGHILEKVTGRTYEDYVEKELFGKLGMSRSSYCSNTEVVPRRAHGYQLQRGGTLARRGYSSHLWPYSAGSLCSTIGDLTAWLQALHGGKVLPPASYREMITPKPLNDGTPVRYAMGLSVAPDQGGRRLIAHGGGISGFVSETRYYPDDDLVMVVLVNTTGNLSPSALASEMVDVLLPRKEQPTRAFTGDTGPLVGTYTGPARGRPMTMIVTAGPNGLEARPEGAGRAMPLTWDDGWTFRAGPVQMLIFEREGGTSGTGPATVLRLDGGGSHYVLRRKPE